MYQPAAPPARLRAPALRTCAVRFSDAAAESAAGPPPTGSLTACAVESAKGQAWLAIRHAVTAHGALSAMRQIRRHLRSERFVDPASQRSPGGLCKPPRHQGPREAPGTAESSCNPHPRPYSRRCVGHFFPSLYNRSLAYSRCLGKVTLSRPRCSAGCRRGVSVASVCHASTGPARPPAARRGRAGPSIARGTYVRRARASTAAACRRAATGRAQQGVPRVTPRRDGRWLRGAYCPRWADAGKQLADAHRNPAAALQALERAASARAQQCERFAALLNPASPWRRRARSQTSGATRRGSRARPRPRRRSSPRSCAWGAGWVVYKAHVW